MLSFPAAGAEVVARSPFEASSLTETEREVALAAAAGATTRAIARQRQTSERTVSNQLASAYRKLGVSSRAELAALLHGTRGL